jgi:aryl-alcohol dehydrogenase-like predicted oxidoreductase
MGSTPPGGAVDTVILGRSGLKVSPICFGTWAFGGEWGAVDVDAATATIRGARDLGVNFFDTAQAYGFGASERLLGAALAGELRASRDELVLATKGGLRREGDRLVRDASREWLHQGVDASLRALGVDVIDLYQVHWPDPKTPFEETAGALAELIDAGKILHAGVSNFDVEEMEAFARHGPLETLQPPYHMFRRAIEDAVLPYCQVNDIGVLAYGPMAHGLLGGRVSPSTVFTADDWRSNSSDFSGDTFRSNLAVVDELKLFAARHDVSLPRLAVAWTLSHPAVDVAIVGATNPRHLDDTVGAADVRLSPDELGEIDAILAHAVPVRGPSPEGM